MIKPLRYTAPRTVLISVYNGVYNMSQFFQRQRLFRWLLMRHSGIRATAGLPGGPTCWPSRSPRTQSEARLRLYSSTASRLHGSRSSGKTTETSRGRTCLQEELEVSGAPVSRDGRFKRLNRRRSRLDGISRCRIAFPLRLLHTQHVTANW